MNSFIAWISGKKLLRKAIMERFPEEDFDRYLKCLVEPDGCCLVRK